MEYVNSINDALKRIEKTNPSDEYNNFFNASNNLINEIHKFVYTKTDLNELSEEQYKLACSSLLELRKFIATINKF